MGLGCKRDILLSSKLLNHIYVVPQTPSLVDVYGKRISKLARSIIVNLHAIVIDNIVVGWSEHVRRWAGTEKLVAA